MNKYEIMQQVADDIKKTFQKYYFNRFEEKKNKQMVIKELAKKYLDSLEERLIAEGYTIKTAKLPRKLKKLYKKTIGILPIEVCINYQLKSFKNEVTE